MSASSNPSPQFVLQRTHHHFNVPGGVDFDTVHPPMNLRVLAAMTVADFRYLLKKYLLLSDVEKAGRSLQEWYDQTQNLPDEDGLADYENWCKENPPL